MLSSLLGGVCCFWALSSSECVISKYLHGCIDALQIKFDLIAVLALIRRKYLHFG